MRQAFFFIILVINSTFGFESFRVNKVERLDERSLFALIASDDQDYSLNLDCQSFFHGLDFEDSHGKHFILLDTYSCGLIYYELTQSLSQGKSMCLHLDFKQKDWALDQDLSSCP